MTPKIDYSAMNGRKKMSNDPARMVWLNSLINCLREEGVELPAEWPAFDPKWSKATQLAYFKAVSTMYGRFYILPRLARWQAGPPVQHPIPAGDATAPPLPGQPVARPEEA